MADDSGLPPPSYAEVIKWSRNTGRGSLSVPLLQDETTFSWHSKDCHEPPSQLELISDSPHSSDDEESIILKQQLRRIRREKLANQCKHLRLRQLLELEQRSSGVAGENDGLIPSKQFTAITDIASGPIIYPLNTNLSEDTHSGVLYHYYPQEVASHSEPSQVHTDTCNDRNALIRIGTTQQTDTYFTENLSENGHSRQQLSNRSSQEGRRICGILQNFWVRNRFFLMLLTIFIIMATVISVIFIFVL